MHPTDEELIAWALGEDAGGTVARHLAGTCPECAARARQVETLLAALRSDRDPDAPAAWVARATAIPDHVSLAKELLERLRRWGRGLAEEAASLVADSAALAPAGVRTAGAARRLRFEAGDVELDLEIEPASGFVRVTGQFAALAPEPRPLARGRFLLVTSSGVWRDGITDALGEFDDRLTDANDLQVRLDHDGRILSFEVPQARPPR